MVAVVWATRRLVNGAASCCQGRHADEVFEVAMSKQRVEGDVEAANGPVEDDDGDGEVH